MCQFDISYYIHIVFALSTLGEHFKWLSFMRECIVSLLFEALLSNLVAGVDMAI